MLNGIILKKLKVIEDKQGKGNIMHVLRRDSEIFTEFGEVYCSFINPGFIKGWKRHLRQTQHFAVPVGNIDVILYDDRDDSNTKGRREKISIGKDNYFLLKIPPMIWYAFKSSKNESAMIINCTDIPHDPDEGQQVDQLEGVSLKF